MKNLLEYLLIHLVDHPEDVKVEESQDDRGLLFTLHVHPEDMGKVIGKGGAVIQAIRTIARIRAIKEGVRAYVVLAEAGEAPHSSASVESASTDSVSDDSTATDSVANEDSTNEDTATEDTSDSATMSDEDTDTEDDTTEDVTE